MGLFAVSLGGLTVVALGSVETALSEGFTALFLGAGKGGNCTQSLLEFPVALTDAGLTAGFCACFCACSIGAEPSGVDKVLLSALPVLFEGLGEGKPAEVFLLGRGGKWIQSALELRVLVFCACEIPVAIVHTDSTRHKRLPKPLVGFNSFNSSGACMVFSTPACI